MRATRKSAHDLAHLTTVHQPINQSTSQPVNQSTNQQINQSTSQPVNQSTSQPTNSPTKQLPTNRTTNYQQPTPQTNTETLDCGGSCKHGSSASRDVKGRQMCRKMQPLSAHGASKTKEKSLGGHVHLEMPRKSCDQSWEERRHEAETTQEQERRSKRQATRSVHKVSR